MKQAALLLLLFACGIPALGQTRDEITVRAVEVPVHVTRNGAPVAGLTRDDFELYVNGQRHPIDYFDVVTDAMHPQARAAAGGETGVRPDLQRRQLYVLLFDVMHSAPHILQWAKESAQKFVAAAPAGDTIAVATISSRGVQFVVPFTTDRIALQRAVATLRPSSANDVFQIATLKSERTGWESSMEMAADASRGAAWGAAAGTGGSVRFDTRSAALAAEAEAKYHEMEKAMQGVLETNYFEALSLLADRLAPLAGMKHVVLLTQGTERPRLTEVLPLHERYRRAGVTLDGVNISGLTGPLDAGDNGGLYTLALETGGAVIKDVSDIGKALRMLREQRNVTYVLGFHPPKNEKKRNSIEVKVRNQPLRGLTTELQYRRSYSPGRSEAAGDGLFLADVLLNDIEQRGITVDVAVQPGAGEAMVVSSVPGVEVMAHARERKTLLDVFVYVFDRQNVVAGWSHSRLLVDVEAGREFLSANPYSVRLPFTLAPGRYVAKTLVRVVGKDVTGFRRSEFTVPGS